MPTIKQRKAFKKALENGGNVTLAMKESEYKEATIHNPENLTKSKGWQELMDQHLPDSVLAKKHRAVLNKKEKIVVSDGNQSGSHIEDTGQPHSDVTKALDLAYKLKGRYKQGDTYFDNRSITINISEDKAKRILDRQALNGSA